MNKDAWIETHSTLDQASIKHYIKTQGGDIYLTLDETNKVDTHISKALDELGWELLRVHDDGIELKHRQG